MKKLLSILIVPLFIIFFMEVFCFLGHTSPGMMGYTGGGATNAYPCNGGSYNNAETCTYYNAVNTKGHTIDNLSDYDNFVSDVKSLTTSGCNGTFPGCLATLNIAHIVGYHLTGGNVDTVDDGADTSANTTATQTTAASRPVYTASCQNGKSCWSFNGGVLNINTMPTFLQGASSLFAAAGGNASIPVYGNVLIYYNTTNTYPYIAITEGVSKVYSFFTNYSSVQYSHAISAVSAASSTFYILETTWDSAWTISSAKINGGTSINPSNNGTQAAGTGQDTALIGSEWIGPIGGYLGFKVELNSADMTTVRNRLHTWYNNY